jgi:hypothetical protein
MNMADIIPGWNSVEAAARWHRGFEIAGFIALGLLLLFEILSYVYGNRKDTLLRIQQGRSADQQQQRDQQVEGERERERSDLKAKIEDARKVAAQSAQSTEAAKRRIKALEHWTLTDKQKTDLMESLSKNPGFNVVVSYNQGDSLAEEYAQQFLQVLHDSKWVAELHAGQSRTVPFGVIIIIGNATTEPPAAVALRIAITAANIPWRGSRDTTEKSDHVELRIGHKPL